jgi:hypothetical protein
LQPVAQVRPRLPGEGLPRLLGPARLERPILARRRIAHVAEHPHHLVVAEERVDRAARPRRLVLQPPDEIERSPRVGSAIEDVAGLPIVIAAVRLYFTEVSEPARLLARHVRDEDLSGSAARFALTALE